MGILVTILVGAVAGWLADLVFKRFSFSIWLQILIGIAGSFVGSWVLGNDLQVMFGLPDLLARILTAFLGALVILGIVAFFKSRQNS
ncbi:MULTISPECIES: GlsB/YeaQ/YmgE family stress response membrane protein [Larkinella]|uniref:GlsB/YeaQ/YmgE family stress response membrane protein n=1 Tax=Larkinella humicola TaxID=2607654 RepID=A0A5N1JET7_9BACT|nr:MULTISPECIES: GlsB/YeaQ/YmgE family stress response membrane protein [Larkinella]KAA9353635.1 GlsB/YeaQ/YmgE family stress response membrane protein [Larkinella humicola]